MSDLPHLSTADLAVLTRQVRELVADRGVTYTDGAHERPWRLDPLPLRIDDTQWEPLAAGLAQRAELLDAVLEDLYGPRRLLRSGLLPPRAVLAHPGYLPVLDGVRLPGPRQLVLAATDVVRTADGWRVVADHAQSPTGAGYALEDRRIVSQVVADTYRESGVHRVGPYFQALRAALVAAAPPGADEPRVAILGPGPRSEGAFDQYSSGAHLGIPVVEGSDLTVRDGRVWLQGLGGGEPVDVLWRRVDAELCDPLDLRRGSRLGVPGLVHAVRSGGVSVVNPLGSGVLESPALLPYLPAVCRALRDEELAVTSAPTYWCGEPTMLSHVLANLATLTLLPTAPAPHVRALHGWTLTHAELAELADRIAAQPDAWVGQERLERDTTPVATPDGPREREAVLRAFAVGGAHGYQLMTGGLARVSPTDTPGAPVAVWAGALAKDVWVTAPTTDPTSARDPWAADDTDPGPRRAARLLSPRSADAMLRIGRYAERAARSVRLLRVVHDRHQDFQHRPGTPGAHALGILSNLLDQEAAPGGPGVLLGAPDVPGTVAADVHQLVDACFDVRDQLSAETWLATAALERSLAAAQPTAHPTPVHEVLDGVTEALLALAGISAESLVQDTGWHLMQAGRRLERALTLTRTLAGAAVVPAPEAVDALVLESLLVAHDSILTYRRRYQARASLASVLDLLLLDATNPRSLAAQVAALHTSFAVVPATPGGTEARARLLGDLDDLLAEADTRALAEPATEPADGLRGRRVRLAELLDSVRWRLEALADDLERLVAPPGAARDLDDGAAEDTGDTRDPEHTQHTQTEDTAAGGDA